jgi:hypothetical protein|tara:strand:+ start:635 stop:1036 length:402 start_codon:yes stop_codon:yes gene_type:complete
MPSLNSIVMQKSSRWMINSLDPRFLDVAEVPGKWGDGIKSGSQFRCLEYRNYAAPFMNEAGRSWKFGLITANQVWELLARPYVAAKKGLMMLREGVCLRNIEAIGPRKFEGGGNPLNDDLKMPIWASLLGLKT